MCFVYIVVDARCTSRINCLYTRRFFGSEWQQIYFMCDNTSSTPVRHHLRLSKPFIFKCMSINSFVSRMACAVRTASKCCRIYFVDELVCDAHIEDPLKRPNYNFACVCVLPRYKRTTRTKWTAKSRIIILKLINKFSICQKFFSSSSPLLTRGIHTAIATLHIFADGFEPKPNHSTINGIRHSNNVKFLPSK